MYQIINLLYIYLHIYLSLVMTVPTFSTLQWNARGIAHKIEDILDSCTEKPDILLFQETNLLKNLNFQIEGYNVFRFGGKKQVGALGMESLQQLGKIIWVWLQGK